MVIDLGKLGEPERPDFDPLKPLWGQRITKGPDGAFLRSRMPENPDMTLAGLARRDIEDLAADWRDEAAGERLEGTDGSAMAEAHRKRADYLDEWAERLETGTL